MTRFSCIAVLMLIQAAAGFTLAGGAKGKDKDKDFVVKGTLTKDDPKDAQRGGFMQTHTVKMKAGKAYTIDMMSTAFDSYLRLLDPKGKQLAEDDDGGAGLNSRIIFQCTRDGDYKIVTTTFGANQLGAYVMTAKTAAAFITSTAHSRLVGKAAPDFASDFAVNGKPGKLSDFKGKIVVLYFWEVRSSRSDAMLPRVKEWSKAYKSKDVVVIGATFYTSEIGQRVGLDKKTGAIVTVKKADRASDQALLRDFAAFHKIEHQLWAIPKKDALAAFDAYAVNPVPQVVVIDRTGVVRLIEAGGEKNSAEVTKMLEKMVGGEK